MFKDTWVVISTVVMATIYLSTRFGDVSSWQAAQEERAKARELRLALLKSGQDNLSDSLIRLEMTTGMLVYKVKVLEGKVVSVDIFYEDDVAIVNGI